MSVSRYDCQEKRRVSMCCQSCNRASVWLGSKSQHISDFQNEYKWKAKGFKDLPSVSPHHMNLACPIALTMWRLHPTSQVITSRHPQEMSIPPIARTRAPKAATTSALYSMGRPQWAPLLPVHLTPAFTLWSSPFVSCSAAHQPLVFPSDHCHVKLSHSGFSPRKSLSGLCMFATAFSSALQSQTSLVISRLCSLSFSDNSNLASCFHSLISLLLSL